MGKIFKSFVIIALMRAACVYAQGTIFSVLSPINPPEGFVPPALLGTIAGVPEMRIHILELGIGGDADASSGPVLFSALGSDLSFSWSAGQGSAGATYGLSPTPITEGSLGARGFSYAPVSEWAGPGSSVQIRWHGNVDPDGFHTEAFDSQGTFFNDPPGTARAWLRYELVAVPEPASGALIIVGACVILAPLCRRRNKQEPPMA